MNFLIAFIYFLSTIQLLLGQSLNGVQLGFPDTWNGDKHGVLECPSKNIPTFINGYFLCQLSASWGNDSNPYGQKLMNLIDAIGAVGAFHIQNGSVTFSAAYYPSTPYKIWDFYDRDLTKSKISFLAPFSYSNQTATKLWNQVPSDPNQMAIAPNVAFWEIGDNVIGGTEMEDIGYQFDIHTLTDFKLFPFIEDNDIFNNASSDIIPMNIAVHEAMDKNKMIWAGFSAINPKIQHYYQGVLTVDPKGVRRVVGLYDYGQFSYANCTNGKFTGDPHLQAGYMHSITATENYVILPVNSILFNPCDNPASNDTIVAPDLNTQHFNPNIGMRFLVFDKRTLKFATQTPIETMNAMYSSHMLNAYELNDTTLIADMCPWPNDDIEKIFMYKDELTKNLFPKEVNVTRFTIDLKQHTVLETPIVPESLAIEFPQYNHVYKMKPYSYGYVVQYPYAAGNSILKINVNDHSGKSNLVYQAKSTVCVHEPQFVPHPNAKDEDDGVIIIRGLDMQSGKGQLIILDAKTMQEIGSAGVPISIPFGFHNRFFAVQSNDPSPTGSSNPTSPTSSNPNPPGGSSIRESGMIMLYLISIMICLFV